MNTDDILEQIDRALDDWTVGPDAMRGSPDRPDFSAAGKWTTPPERLEGYIEAMRVWTEQVAAVADESWQILPWQLSFLERALTGQAHTVVTPRGQGCSLLPAHLWDAAVQQQPPAGHVPLAVGFDPAEDGDTQNLVIAWGDPAPNIEARRIWLQTWVQSGA